ncbi:hypothetical protein [Halothermothrix orenii]|uniref:Uncharacterized protein n=1 Tax=Halothermothrix orenii (strain H 168 / OCM 544 / DSM 9562) TaxID=373903 RepID=B8CZT7_HALOH|nr:hypothetical protein [Halothermothrix orenii]ACL70789.1 hypothetical protein Hore_20440 [Halothermothrix orenii H 168]
MKKGLIFGLAVVLTMVLSLGVMAAGNDSGTVNVTASVAKYVNINFTDTSINFGELQVNGENTTNLSFTVEANYTDWSVRVSPVGNTNKMTGTDASGQTVSLTNPLQVALNDTNYENLQVTGNIYTVVSSIGTNNMTLNLKQPVVVEDPVASYSIDLMVEIASTF